MLAPLAEHTTLSLRVLARRPLDLAALGELRTVPAPVGDLLRAVVARRLAFVVTGGTGTGKTTLLGALLGEVGPAERLLVIEDAPELVVAHPHLVRLVTRPANVEGAGEVGLRELVRQALRMRPDRLVVGEFRGAEMVELLVALNTGHEGSAATLHANSAADVPARFARSARSRGCRRPPSPAWWRARSTSSCICGAATAGGGRLPRSPCSSGSATSWQWRRPGRPGPVSARPRRCCGAVLAGGRHELGTLAGAGGSARPPAGSSARPRAARHPDGWSAAGGARAAAPPLVPSAVPKGAIVVAGGGAIVLAVAVLGGPALAAAAAALLGLGAVLLRDLLRRREHTARQRDLLAGVQALVAEFESGAGPPVALEAAAEAGPRVRADFAAAAAAAARGGAAADVLCACGDGALRAVGHAWRLGDDTGAPLAGVLGRVAADLAAAQEQRRTVAVALAGPRSSAAVLSGLPLLGIGLGVAMGARPLPFLLATAPGRLLCCLGVLLDVAGVLWMRRLLRRAEQQ